MRMRVQQLTSRFHRQLILSGFGMEAQLKLLGARVLVVGAGGLGCPVLMVLAGAGVGSIGIADDGLVELSNLHRQLIYTTADVGHPKVACAQRVVRALNPGVAVQTYPDRLVTGNAFDILQDYDVVIDGTDNFPSRYMLNDACALLGKPLLYGAVSRYEGQVALFPGGVTYRDIFPYPPHGAEVANCSETGVLGVLPGIIGNFMANECIKFLTGTGEVLRGRLLTYNALDNQVFTVDIPPTALGAELLPRSRAIFEATDYPTLCSVKWETEHEIDVAGFRTLLEQREVDLIDVRECHEKPDLVGISHRRIPLSTLSANVDLIARDAVIFVCQSGKRSLQAISMYKAACAGPTTHLYSLKGGVNALMKEGIYLA